MNRHTTSPKLKRSADTGLSRCGGLYFAGMELSKLHADFWSLVEECPVTGCWNWVGKLWPKTGYGLCFFSNLKGHRYTHRYSYETLVGVIPQGMVIDHLCRNRACCNPIHLEVVSQRTNLMRGVATWARINSEKKRCKEGHLLSGDNLRITTTHNGRYKHRTCRACVAEACKRYRNKKKQRRSGITIKVGTTADNV